MMFDKAEPTHERTAEFVFPGSLGLSLRVKKVSRTRLWGVAAQKQRTAWMWKVLRDFFFPSVSRGNYSTVSASSVSGLLRVPNVVLVTRVSRLLECVPSV